MSGRIADPGPQSKGPAQAIDVGGTLGTWRKCWSGLWVQATCQPRGDAIPQLHSGVKLFQPLHASKLTARSLTPGPPRVQRGKISGL